MTKPKKKIKSKKKRISAAETSTDDGLWETIRKRAHIVIVSAASLLTVSVVAYFILQDSQQKPVEEASTVKCEIRLLIETDKDKQWVKFTPPKDMSLSQVEFEGAPRIHGMEVEGCAG